MGTIHHFGRGLWFAFFVFGFVPFWWRALLLKRYAKEHGLPREYPSLFATSREKQMINAVMQPAANLPRIKLLGRVSDISFLLFFILVTLSLFDK